MDFRCGPVWRYTVRMWWYGLGSALSLMGCTVPVTASPTVVDTSDDAPSTETDPPETSSPDVLAESVAVVFNEVQTDNTRTVTDPSGAHEDWIELRNLTDVALDLGGYHLTDDPARPTRFRIPAGVVLPARGHLLLWADDDPEQGPTHLNFRLSSGGEYVGLFGPDELSGLTLDEVEVPALREDHSYARARDGRGDFERSASPTPGAPNRPGNRSAR